MWRNKNFKDTGLKNYLTIFASAYGIGSYEKEAGQKFKESMNSSNRCIAESKKSLELGNKVLMESSLATNPQQKYMEQLIEKENSLRAETIGNYRTNMGMSGHIVDNDKLLDISKGFGK